MYFWSQRLGIVTRKTIACANTDYLLHSECRVNYAHQCCACNGIFNYCFRKSIYEDKHSIENINITGLDCM